MEKTSKLGENVCNEMPTLEFQRFPHIGERILEHFTDPELITYRSVSKSWKETAEELLVKRWKGRVIDACDEYQNSRIIIVKLLLELGGQGIDWNEKSFGDTALTVACRSGNKAVIKLLLDYSDRNNIELATRDENGQIEQTAFYTVISENYLFPNLDIVKLLLDYSGAKSIEPNAKFGDNSVTAFIEACQGGWTDLVKLLIDYSEIKQIDMNAQGTDGCTGLMVACKNNHINILKLLLERGPTSIDWNKTIHKDTALTAACRSGNKAVVKLLLDYSDRNNIELVTKDENGKIKQTALHIAVSQGHLDIVKLLLDYSGTKSIEVNAECEYDDFFYGDFTPFTTACINGQTEIVRLLLDYSDSKDIDLKTNWPFWFACMADRTSVVELLLRHPHAKAGIEFNQIDFEGDTPLTYVCEMRKTDLVKLILDYSDELNIDLPSDEDIECYDKNIQDLIIKTKSRRKRRKLS